MQHPRPCRLASEEIHHQFRDQLRLIVLHLVARVGHIMKLDVSQHCFQLSAECHGGKSIILAQMPMVGIVSFGRV
jgi:hypothetical protein